LAKDLRYRVHKLLTPEADDRGLERFVNLLLGGLIVANVLAVVLETVEDLPFPSPGAFRAFDHLSVSVFSLEYALRLWSCTVDPRFRGRLGGRLRYVLTPMALIDLVAIVPSLIPGVDLDLRFARIVRLLRLARALKIARYSESLKVLTRVVRSKREELGITAFAGFILLMCASCGLYFAEHDAQPGIFSSIPASMWWGVTTLTTVGYGDIYPVTTAGKLIASVIAVLGIGLFALPTGILAAGFAEEMRRPRETTRTCPHCGREIGG